MISNEEWADCKDGSGKLSNPGKKFFLQLAAEVIMEVDNDRDTEGILYSRKSMMGCGLALNLNGKWKEQQLFPHLQVIVGKYRENFNGKSVADSMELDGAETESYKEYTEGDINGETV